MPIEPGASDLEASARRFHERQLEDPPHRIAALIHEDAEMVSLAADAAEAQAARRRLLAGWVLLVAGLVALIVLVVVHAS